MLQVTGRQRQMEKEREREGERERGGGTESGGNFENKSLLCYPGRKWTSPFQQKV